MNKMEQGARKIYKYRLDTVGEQDFDMGDDPNILCVQMQRGEITLWAEVSTEGGTLLTTIHIAGTGFPVPEGPHRYIGSVQDDAGFVWHIYEAFVTPRTVDQG